ncbi:MAG: RnfABCDGE type electron transport complex subunit D [Bacteroidia bacterium]|nr:RnfABCDGE type electron transport complex subunit D [Bacteroidia bacterium]NNF32085.1 RnfABCDGE type electron transport complex subunit D [Flavobacteriaceae bacterium]MBT8275124.1 RnfABCDGE type electron transport complex subunit D [Bacteroidia bacterium]NNJ82265.1 RnfABCDGE type electron transport complex subunit D [Flavobacteriaceae bacterium]NNK54949.1 RnfABCDGE type electron transport complex subunit D [Flavobacteriaceae bacterium]
MTDERIIISASPHVHSDSTSKKLMYDVLIALIPAFIVTLYVFGISALIMTSVAVISCILFEYLIQKYLLKTAVTVSDGSALITGILLAFNLPSSLPLWMVITGSFVAIGIAKMSFGGLGYNIFNPALVGRVFLFISFPAQMSSWPVPVENNMTLVDAISGETTLGIIKEGLMYGETMSTLSMQIPSMTELLLGFTSGSAGEMSALALILGGLYLLIRKVITWHIPITILVTMAVFTGIFWLVDPEQYANPLIHILSGGAVLGAFYMATDLVTSPMTKKGMIIFAVGIAVITVVIRLFGAYPEGISFAILIMNAFVPLINSYFKPRRFGNKIKAKIV